MFEFNCVFKMTRKHATDPFDGIQLNQGPMLINYDN